MGPDVHCSATVAALTEARVLAPVRNNANFDELRQQHVSARNRPDHATSRYSWMRLPRTSDRRSCSAFDVADQARSHVGLGWWALTEVCPWCSDGSLDHPDTFRGEDGSGELRASVADEELDGVRLLGELHANVASLLGHPLADRMSRHTGNSDQAHVVVDEEEHVESAEQHRVDAQEVAGHQALRLGGEKLRPCWP